MSTDDYRGDGYEISVRTDVGRVLVHMTRSACDVLGGPEESCLGVIARNGNIIAAIVHRLVTEPAQMRVTIDATKVRRFLATRH